MRWKEINEAPISHLGVHGDLDTEGSFRSSDLKALKNPKWAKKVTDMFERVPFDINLYFYNAPEGKTDLVRKDYDDSAEQRLLRRFQQEHGIEVKPQGSEVDVRDTRNLSRYAGSIESYRVKGLVGELPQNWHTAINAILLSNEGSDRMSMTPWMVGHRLMHALFYDTQRGGNMSRQHDKLFNIYTSFLNGCKGRLYRSMQHPVFNARIEYTTETEMTNAVSEIIGTTRAARTGKHINSGEWLVDICTQWLVRGSVHFQRPKMCNKGVTTEPEPKETPLLKAAREFAAKHEWEAHKPQAFVNAYVKTHYEQPSPNSPRFQPDYWAYNVFDKNGRIVAVGKYSEERLADLRDEGYRVEKVGPDDYAQESQQYRKYLQRKARIYNQYLEWFRNGMLEAPEKRGTYTDQFHRYLTNEEQRFDDAISEYMQASIGKWYIL